MQTHPGDLPIAGHGDARPNVSLIVSLVSREQGYSRGSQTSPILRSLRAVTESTEQKSTCEPHYDRPRTERRKGCPSWREARSHRRAGHNKRQAVQQQCQGFSLALLRPAPDISASYPVGVYLPGSINPLYTGVEARGLRDWDGCKVACRWCAPCFLDCGVHWLKSSWKCQLPRSITLCLQGRAQPAKRDKCCMRIEPGRYHRHRYAPAGTRAMDPHSNGDATSMALELVGSAMMAVSRGESGYEVIHPVTGHLLGKIGKSPGKRNKVTGVSILWNGSFLASRDRGVLSSTVGGLLRLHAPPAGVDEGQKRLAAAGPGSCKRCRLGAATKWAPIPRSLKGINICGCLGAQAARGRNSAAGTSRRPATALQCTQTRGWQRSEPRGASLLCGT